MKTAGVLMSIAAIVAGVVVARLEYERDEKARADEVEQADSSRGVDPSAGAPSARVEKRARPAAEGDVVRPGTPEGTPPDSVSPEDDGTKRAASDEAERRQREIESLLARQRFGEAVEAAQALIGALEAAGLAPSSELLVAARRLAARARVFQRLVDNIEHGDGKPAIKRVRLANGNTIEVVSAEKDGDRYILELTNGISYRPRADAVVEVREMSDAEVRDFVDAEWSRLRKRLETVRDPVTLYVRGVQRCYRWGLRGEGLKLLERILELPDSAVVPRRFAGSDAAAAEREWQLAAGRLQGRKETRAEEANGARTASDRGLEPSRREGPASRSGIIRQVTSLRDEARELFRRAYRHGGDSRDLREARERLERAFALLEPLTEDEETDALTRDLGQILSDVVRVSPF